MVALSHKQNISTDNCNGISSLTIDTQLASSSTSNPIPNFIKRRHNNNNNCQNSNDNGADDVYSNYRRLCEVRMRRLERYKKARSFCSLHDESNNNANKHFNTNISFDNDAISINGNHKKNFYKDPPEQQQRRKDDQHAETFRSSNEIQNNYNKFENAMRATSSSCLHLAIKNCTKDEVKNEEHFPKQEFFCKQYDNRDTQRKQWASSHSNLSSLSTTETSFDNVKKSRTHPTSIFVDIDAKSDDEILKLDQNSTDFLMKPSTICVDNETSTKIEEVAETNTENKNCLVSTNVQFEILREKMISMMENDVQLLKKLLTLGETIQELRKNSTEESSNQLELLEQDNLLSDQLNTHEDHLHCPKSNPDIDSEEKCSEKYYAESQEEDDWRPLNPSKPNPSSVTRLFIGEDDNFDNYDENDKKPNVQYFSRKNSVLRIPIPPRASNRMLGKKIQLRSELLRFSRKASYSSTKLPMPEEDSGHSSASNSPPAQCSPNGSITNQLSKKMHDLNDNLDLSTANTNIKQFGFNYKMSNKSDLLCTEDSQAIGRTALDFETASTIDSGSSRYSTFSSESFSIGTVSSIECNDKTEFNCRGKRNEQTSEKKDYKRNANNVIINLEGQCIISNS